MTVLLLPLCCRCCCLVVLAVVVTVVVVIVIVLLLEKKLCEIAIVEATKRLGMYLRSLRNMSTVLLY